MDCLRLRFASGSDHGSPHGGRRDVPSTRNRVAASRIELGAVKRPRTVLRWREITSSERRPMVHTAPVPEGFRRVLGRLHIPLSVLEPL